MRIGMMADTYKPHISGITNHIDLTKRYLEKAGHQVYVFTFGDLEFQDDDENVVRSPGLPLIDTGYYLSFRYKREAKQLLQTMDIAHVHHPFLSGRLALRYCRPLNIPIVFTNHTRYDLYAQAYLPGLPESVSEALLESFLPSFCDAVDMVVSPSKGMAEVLRRLKVDAPVTIVPNGVELGLFQEAQSAARRSDLGIPVNAILFIYVGRLDPVKNLSFLIKSFAGVAQAVDNAYLLLVGGGPAEEELKNLAAQSLSGNRIRFAGSVKYTELPGYLSMCDAFATASVTEVHPLSVIEAMASGLPVLGIQSPGVGDTVEHGSTGYLSSADLPAFTALMTRLAIDKDGRLQMGKNARKASKQYAIENTTRLMINHYDRLILEYRPLQKGMMHRIRSIVERVRR